MYIEVIYYNTETTLYTSRYTMQGDVDPSQHPTTDPDAGILTFTEPSAARDDNFRDYTGQKVVDGQLVFGYEPWPEPPEPGPYDGVTREDAITALEILGVEPEEVLT